MEEATINAVSYICSVPEEILLKILSFLPPHQQYYVAKLVCRKWNRVIKTIAKQQTQLFISCVKRNQLRWYTCKQCSNEVTEKVLPGPRDGQLLHYCTSQRQYGVPAPRFSHASAVVGRFMYLFGGSNSELASSSTYNDLHQFDLVTRRWIKSHPQGLLPAPRECCTFVTYKKTIIMFGGWCQPRKESIPPRFFEDTQILYTDEVRWERVPSQVESMCPPARAGHSCSVIGQELVIFGGSQRNKRLNDVWVFNIPLKTWRCPFIRGAAPKERFGQLQFTLDERYILIVGGCGGPHELFGDAWLLDTRLWCWTQLTVDNQLCEPPDVWCHSAVKVGNYVIVISEEKKCPYCRCPIQMFMVPSVKAQASDTFCTCGRKNPEQMAQTLQTTLQTYILDCSLATSNFYCRWQDYRFRVGSPPSRRLFSASCGINEILIFGGLQNLSSLEKKLDDVTIIISIPGM